MSVTEVARIQTTDGDAFAALFQQGIDSIRAAAGCLSASGGRCVEQPDDFVVVIEWTEIAAHEAFRETPAFGDFAGAVAHLLAAPPAGLHYDIAP